MKIHTIGKFMYLILLLLSNSCMIFFIFPIAYDIIKIYNPELVSSITNTNQNDFSFISFGILIAIMLTAHEVSNLCAFFIWRKFKSCLSASSITYISMAILLISNFLFIFATNLTQIIFLRIISAMFNALPLIIEDYTNQNSNFNLKEKINLLTYITMAISFLIGSCTTEVVPVLQLQFTLGNLFNTQVNKYYMIVLIVNIILIITLLSTMLCKFSLQLSPDRALVHNQTHFATQNEEECGADNNHAQANELNRESLVLYNDSLVANSKSEKLQESFNSHEINSIMEKDEVMQGNYLSEYSRAAREDRLHDNDLVYDESNLQNKKKEEFVALKQENMSTDEGKSPSISNNRQYIMLRNDTHINTVDIPCDTLMKYDTDNKEKTNKQIEIEMEVKFHCNDEDASREVNFVKENDIKDLNKISKRQIITKNNVPTLKANEATSEAINHIEHINKNYNYLKLALLFCMIKISKNVLLNLFLFFLFSPTLFSGLELSTSSIGITLAVTCIKSFISHLFMSKLFIKNDEKVKFKLMITLIITQIVFLGLLLPYIYSSLLGYTIKIIYTCACYVWCNASIDNSMAFYNLVIKSNEQAQSNRKYKKINAWLPYALRLVISYAEFILISFFIFGQMKICIIVLTAVFLLTGLISIYLVKQF